MWGTCTTVMFGSAVLQPHQDRVRTAYTPGRKPCKANGAVGTRSRRNVDAPRKRRPSGVDAPAAVFARFVSTLAAGDHEFAELREAFGGWLEAACGDDAALVPDVMLRNG